MGFFDSPCKVKCTDEVIDNGDLPCLGFLVCVGHFDAVNKFSENCRVKLLHKGRLDELVELMVDTVCSNRESIRIAGDDYPAEVVRARLLKLNSSHIEYVLDRMRENTTYVRNIKKYLLAALYNAPATIDSYYTSLVSHDLYGSGDRR